MSTLSRICDACKEGKHSECSNVIKKRTDLPEFTYACLCCGNTPSRVRKLKENREQRNTKNTEADVNEENTENEEDVESDKSNENERRYYYSTASVVSPPRHVSPCQYNKPEYKKGGDSTSGKTAKEVTNPPNCTPTGNDIYHVYHGYRNDDVFNRMDDSTEETKNKNVEDLLVELKEAVECNKESLDKLKERLEPIISKYIPISLTYFKNNRAQKYSPIKNKLLKILSEVEDQNNVIHRLLRTTKDLE